MSEDKLTRIEDKIDVMGDKLSSIDTTLAEQHVSLKEHMRRTEMLEAQLEPIKTHVSMVNGGIKLLGILALIIGAVTSILLVIVEGRK